MKAIAQHSSSTAEHYTPSAFIEAARLTMGGIDLDPATTAFVNHNRVGAKMFYTEGDDGLSSQWYGKVWLNPPGGRLGKKSRAAVWWEKLFEEYRADRIEQAIFLGFTLEILATSQDADNWVGGFPFCVPRNRIEFDTVHHEQFVKGESPTHSNIICFLPPHADYHAAVHRFHTQFSKFGRVSA